MLLFSIKSLIFSKMSLLSLLMCLLLQNFHFPDSQVSISPKIFTFHTHKSLFIFPKSSHFTRTSLFLFSQNLHFFPQMSQFLPKSALLAIKCLNFSQNFHFLRSNVSNSPKIPLFALKSLYFFQNLHCSHSNVSISPKIFTFRIHRSSFFQIFSLKYLNVSKTFTYLHQLRLVSTWGQLITESV